MITRRIRHERHRKALLLWAALPFLVGCSPKGKPNQEQPARSPSGAYVAVVPVEPASGREFKSYWHPIIRDANGLEQYKDSDGYPARFNVYWHWDSDDRFWVKNSDDGQLYYYKLTQGVWSKNIYEPTSISPTTHPAPPAELLSR
jgi:hypothetical protein